MSNLSKLDEVVEILERDVNLIRIKKVMICACQGKWENNPNTLKNFAVKDLVKELYWRTQSPENLYKILDRILSKINKKSDYTLIVNTILHQVGRLYVEKQSEGLNGQGVKDEPLFRQPPRFPAVEETELPPEFNAISSPTNLFDIRWRIMQYTNPLRVKLLLFSTLEREFNFADGDWSQIKLQTLDDLLRQLLQTFPSFSDLKANLTKMANYLDNPDENLQAVTVISETLKEIYGQPGEQKSGAPLEAFNRRADSVHPETVGQASHQSNLISTEQTAVYSPLNPQSNSSENTSVIDTFLNEKLSLTQSSLVSTNLQTEELENPNNQLESQVNQLINKHIKSAIYPLEETWDKLQNLLDFSCQNLTAEDCFDLKKQALQKFLNVIGFKVNELQQSLNNLETTQLQSWQSVDFSQQKIMELARKGNPKAIANLINQSLESRGIHTQVKSQNGCLHVVLTAEPIPDSKTTASFIHHKLIFLKIQSIQTVKIYGRQKGKKSIAWTQEYTYN